MTHSLDAVNIAPTLDLQQMETLQNYMEPQISFPFLQCLAQRMISFFPTNFHPYM